MTGIFVRIERDGRWQLLEFDQLTDAEMVAFIKTQPLTEGWSWAFRLAAWIRDHVEATRGGG